MDRQRSGTADRMRPVSYTHLDVYKRQNKRPPMIFYFIIEDLLLIPIYRKIFIHSFSVMNMGREKQNFIFSTDPGVFKSPNSKQSKKCWSPFEIKDSGTFGTWRQQDSNLRPSTRQADALPAELCLQRN